MFSITTESNYLAQIVQLEEPKKHPNADRLQIWNVRGYEVITDMSRKSGDVCIYFPPECQINKDILSKLNLFSDKELNTDQQQVGYVHKSGRVRAIALRGIISEGMILPASQVFSTIFNNIAWIDWIKHLGTSFDTIDNKVICQKYIPIIKEVRSGGQGKGPRLNTILIPGQFNFHYNTSKLQDNIWRFDNMSDLIVISSKWHGTSAVFSNLLTKKKLSIWQKILNFFGQQIPTEEYSKMYASRTVLKSIENKFNVPNGGYYNSDIWGKVFEEIKHVLFPGYTVYGEIVGYVGDKLIQKDYDYGCKPGEHKFLIYIITETDKSGNTIEFSWDDIKDFCKEHNLQHVPQLFYGNQHDWYEQHKSLGDGILDELKLQYLEKDCTYCVNKVPAEGICIRNESGNKIAYKLKSKRFLAKESKELDSGEEVVE
jgi:tRNA-binding EMAP/Myf-like protein